MRASRRSARAATRHPTLAEWFAWPALRNAIIPSAVLWALIIWGVLALMGCGTANTPAPQPEHKVDIVSVGVPLKQSCVPVTLGPPPQYVDTDAAIKAAPDPGAAIQILGAGRKQRIARANETEPVIEHCR